MDGRTRTAALIIVRGGGDSFANLHGRRIAEALRELNFQAEVGTLASVPSRLYDWGVLVAPTEWLHAAGEAAGLEQMRTLRRRCKALASSSLDAARAPGFEYLWRCCQAIGVDVMLDFGFHDPSERLPPDVRNAYRFVMAGLTPSELRALDGADRSDADRPIPWALVGPYSADRVGLAGHLVRTVDPRGFVHLSPAATPRAGQDARPLGQRQLDALQRRTRYQIWCPDRGEVCAESESFRTALLAGAVPVTVRTTPRPADGPGPFDYLVMGLDDVGRVLSSLDFDEVRRRFRADFRRLKSLPAALAEHLVAGGLPRRGGGQPRLAA